MIIRSEHFFKNGLILQEIPELFHINNRVAIVLDPSGPFYKLLNRKELLMRNMRTQKLRNHSLLHGPPPPLNIPRLPMLTKPPTNIAYRTNHRLVLFLPQQIRTERPSQGRFLHTHNGHHQLSTKLMQQGK